MKFYANWSESTPVGPIPLDGDYGIRELPKQCADVAGEPGATNIDALLATNVRQWLTIAATVDGPAPSGSGENALASVVTGTQWVDPVDSVALLIDVTEVPVDEPSHALPRRHRRPQPRPSRRLSDAPSRLAVLIDAGTTAPGSTEALFDVLADHGGVSVCRAYADWTSPETRWWSSSLRDYGIQPQHHFGHAEDHRALVSLTIDAVDLVHEAIVDMVVIVGDLVSLHPLVARLNASGVPVLAFGTTETPRDVQALCHDFVDLAALTHLHTAGTGKHRA